MRRTAKVILTGRAFQPAALADLFTDQAAGRFGTILLMVAIPIVGKEERPAMTAFAQSLVTAAHASNPKSP
jgi:hypothetical protein